MRRVRRFARWAVCAAWAPVLAASMSHAQDAADAAPVDADIARALEEDAKAAAEEVATQESPSPSPSAAAPAPNAGAGFLALLPDIALLGDFALAAFSEEEPLQTGGHDPQRRGFALQQLELALSKAVDPYFQLNAIIVFSQFGVEIEEAYATTLALPGRLQLRAGQFLTRFGRINPTHVHAWNFVDQPFAVGRVFGGEGNRGLGVEGSVLLPLPWFAEALASMTEAGGEATARSFFGGSGLGVRRPLDFQFTGALKQFFPASDDFSVLWGLSAATGPNPTGAGNRSDVYGTDLYLKYRPVSGASTTVVSLQTEWFYRRRQIPDSILEDVSSYTELFWRFAQRWGVAVRHELGTPATGGVDFLDPEWTRTRHRVSNSWTFWPTEFSRLRAQAAVDAPRWTNELQWSAFLALEVGIGAHAAHAF